MDSHSNLIDFSSVLASTVHDMKNSLCMLLQSIDTMAQDKNQNPQTAEELAKIHYEASRLNTNLLQMLSLYRVEKDQLPLMIEEHYIEDLVEELIEKNLLYIDNKAIKVETNLEENIMWYFDDGLVGNLLNDIFVNALRYTKDTITISAKIIDEHLQINICDNGRGYPEHMLCDNELPMQDFDIDNNRTGLGLFFAKMIAKAHTNKDKAGYIKLSNDKQFGGSVFTLVLP
jgi:K+-sensing histidine kinase KdpD